MARIIQPLSERTRALLALQIFDEASSDVQGVQGSGLHQGVGRRGSVYGKLGGVSVREAWPDEKKCSSADSSTSVQKFLRSLERWRFSLMDIYWYLRIRQAYAVQCVMEYFGNDASMSLKSCGRWRICQEAVRSEIVDQVLAYSDEQADDDKEKQFALDFDRNVWYYATKFGRVRIKTVEEFEFLIAQTFPEHWDAQQKREALITFKGMLHQGGIPYAVTAGLKVANAMEEGQCMVLPCVGTLSPKSSTTFTISPTNFSAGYSIKTELKNPQGKSLLINGRLKGRPADAEVIVGSTFFHQSMTSNATTKLELVADMGRDPKRPTLNCPEIGGFYEIRPKTAKELKEEANVLAAIEAGRRAKKLTVSTTEIQ